MCQTAFNSFALVKIQKIDKFPNTLKSQRIEFNDGKAMESEEEGDQNIGNSSIEKLLTLKYRPSSHFFTPEFLSENEIEPDWKAAKISGQEYIEGFLLKTGYKGNIPSSLDYTVYNIKRASSKRNFKIFICHY